MPSYSDFKDFPLRPLSKGMFTDMPANGIPSGGFSNLKNFKVKEGYIETRGGFYPFFDGSADLAGDDLIAYDFGNLREKIHSVIYNWKTTAQSETLIVSDDFLYQIFDRTTLNHIEFTSGELTIADVLQDDTDFSFTIASGTTTNIRTGDYVRVFGETVAVAQIININSGTGIYSCKIDPSITWSGTSAEIVHTFTVSPGYTVDYTVLGGYGTDEAGNELILTDQADRGLYKYSDGVLSIYETDSSPDGDEDPLLQTLGSAKCCTFFDDRLWLGNITETDGKNYPQRIWWSDALNFDRFDPAGYFDLPYSEGELLMIKPLGPLLVAYFTDTIYIGQPTQITGRPYEFQEIGTNEVGLVSQKALTVYDDGHFFVGQDDIYYLSGSRALQRIGAPIRSRTVEQTAKLGLLDYIQAASDPENESVAFLFPNLSADVTDAKGLSSEIWRFYYKPQAWCYDEVPMSGDTPQAYFSSLSSARAVTRNATYQTWQDLDGSAGDPTDATNSDDYTQEWLGNRDLNAIFKDDETVSGTPPADQQEWYDLSSYADLNSFSISVPRLFIGTYFIDTPGYYLQNILFQSPTNDKDVIGEIEYDIDYEIISADHDFGVPDGDKFTRNLSIRTMEHVDDYFQPELWVSDGKARRNSTSGRQEIWWQKTQPVRFFTNYNEGQAGFLIRGSIFKFKIKFVRGEEIYRISEIIIRSKVEANQVDQ
jgi:hypothetical protein